MDDEILLNNKYIKTKKNWKQEVKFFGPFWVLHFVGKQTYKLELLKKWKVYNVFYMLMLKQNTTKKKQVKKITKLNANNDGEEYKGGEIWHSAVYANKLESGYLPDLYYLIT